VLSDSVALPLLGVIGVDWVPGYVFADAQSTQVKEFRDMPQSDIFALKDSSFNAFLFADVGTEDNGSELTILSVLARLGKDPWAEAALWAQEPASATIDSLAACLGCMPLSRRSLENARATASRLVELLPKQSGAAGQSAHPRAGVQVTPNWGYVACITVGLYLVLSLSTGFPPKPNTTTTTPIEQSTGHPR
jgi:hypothetical protein